MDTEISIHTLRSYIMVCPDLMSDINNMLEYRNLRTEQCYYSKLCYEYDYVEWSKIKEVREAGEIDRKYWGNRIIVLDKERRDTHNAALNSFINFVKVGEKYKLPSVYSGQMLTYEEVKRHDYASLRTCMTDAMFNILKVIEDSVIEKDDVMERLVNNKFRDLQEDIEKNNRMFSVRAPITKDEDDPPIFDFKGLNKFFENLF